MTGYDWMRGLPKQETSVPYELCQPLEGLIAQAHLEQDHALLRAAASAWLLAGFAPQWIVCPLRITKPGCAFVEAAFRGRERSKIRNEGRGLLRAMMALHRAKT